MFVGEMVSKGGGLQKGPRKKEGAGRPQSARHAPLRTACRSWRRRWAQCGPARRARRPRRPQRRQSGRARRRCSTPRPPAAPPGPRRTPRRHWRFCCHWQGWPCPPRTAWWCHWRLRCGTRRRAGRARSRRTRRSPAGCSIPAPCRTWRRRRRRLQRAAGAPAAGARQAPGLGQRPRRAFEGQRCGARARGGYQAAAVSGQPCSPNVLRACCATTPQRRFRCRPLLERSVPFFRRGSLLRTFPWPLGARTHGSFPLQKRPQSSARTCPPPLLAPAPARRPGTPPPPPPRAPRQNIARHAARRWRGRRRRARPQAQAPRV